MSDLAYEPTREHWTPYEPWMRHVLADDARMSWASSGTESRSTWYAYGLRTDSWAAGVDLRVHPDDVPERPTEADPDEALAVVIEELVDVHGGTSEWADNEYITRSTALAIARAAREHIEAEHEEGGYNIRRAERERRYRVEAEADLARVTKERDRQSRAADKWCNLYVDKCEEIERLRVRYDALRADVERDRRNQTTFTDVLRALGRDGGER